MQPRERDDRCPGVLRLADAVDGGLARVRLPGGLVSATGLRVLAAAARDLGDGRLELTSRGNVQLRALPLDAGAELGGRLATAGLWPSESHEQVRNIVASPLAGVSGGTDLELLVRALDERLCAEPDMARLSGRFLFGLDDGRGDIAALRPDVIAVVASSSAWVEGLRVRLIDLPGAMLAVARAFLVERGEGTAWRVAELPGGHGAVLARLGRTGSPPPVAAGVASAAGFVGPLAQPDGRHALVVLPPLGRLAASQAERIADVLDGRAHVGRDARITPWRTVVLPDLAASGAAAEALRAAGVVTEAGSPWVGVSACAGRPGCGNALADVQADAAAALGRWPGQRVHWSGCARRCGAPREPHVDVLATGAGYAITP